MNINDIECPKKRIQIRWQESLVRYENHLGRKPSDGEEKSLFLNFVRMKLGMNHIVNTINNTKREKTKPFDQTRGAK